MFFQSAWVSRGIVALKYLLSCLLVVLFACAACFLVENMMDLILLGLKVKLIAFHRKMQKNF